MTTRSIIDIEVNSEQFDRFRAGFASFQEQVRRTPGALNQSVRGFERMEDLVEMIAYNTHRAAADQDRMRRATDASVGSMTRLARASRAVAGETLNVTKNLLQWSGIAVGVAGLLAGGGMFGINRMIGGLVQNQRNAGAMTGPTGIGAPGAFKTTFGQYLSTDSILSNVSAMQLSSDKTAFNALGMSERQYSRNMATPDVAVNVIAAMKDWLNKHPNASSELIESSQLTRLMSLEDINQLRNSNRWRGLIHGEYPEYKRQFAMSGASADEAARVGRTFDASQTVIGNALIKGVQPLLGPLGELSKAIAEAVKTILGSQGMKDAIESLSKGIREFASYLTSSEFRADMYDLLDVLRAIVGGIGKAAGAVFGKDENETALSRLEAKNRLGYRSLRNVYEIGENSLKGLPLRMRATEGFNERFMEVAPAIADAIAKGQLTRDRIDYLSAYIAAGPRQSEFMNNDIGRHKSTTDQYLQQASNRVEIQLINMTGGNAGTIINGAAAAQ